MASARRFLAILFTIESGVAIVAYLLIAGLLLGDVALRELAGSSIRGAQRISVYLMIVTGFLGLGLAADRGRHLRPQFADGLIPKAFVATADRIGSLIMALVFGYFAFKGIAFVRAAFEYGDLARTIKTPLWMIEIVVPYALASLSLRYVLYTIWPELKPTEALES